MTRVCPKCGRRYTDAAFEFCLEDGARLMQAAADEPETQVGAPVTFRSKTFEIVPPTLKRDSNLSDWESRQNQETFFGQPIEKNAQTVQTENAQDFVDKTASPAQQTIARFVENKAAAIAAIGLALAHNYWQWLYVARANGFEFSTVAVWFLLLVCAAAISVAVLRFNRAGRSLAIVGLVMLAVNLLLYLVPKRF